MVLGLFTQDAEGGHRDGISSRFRPKDRGQSGSDLEHRSWILGYGLFQLVENGIFVHKDHDCTRIRMDLSSGNSQIRPWGCAHGSNSMVDAMYPLLTIYLTRKCSSPVIVAIIPEDKLQMLVA